MTVSEKIIRLIESFAARLDAMRFSFDGYVYNPLDYAREPFLMYLRRYLDHTVENVFLGMNPGPFGMMQTGIPFGEVTAVKEYLRIDASSCSVSTPERYHPARPVLGFGVGRSEVSGRRFWSLIRRAFPDPADFFAYNAVLNYCPLAFISAESTARNVTPDKLPRPEREELEALCTKHLADVLCLLEPRNVIGIGKYAYERASEAVRTAGIGASVLQVIHPSPANPAANKDWEGRTLTVLKDAGVWRV